MKQTWTLAAALVVLAAGPALAQQVEIEAPAPEARRAPEVVPPPLHYETTRPTDADFYPNPPRVRHDPAFIEPFAAKTQTTTSTGRVGLSGWTAPNTPIGPPVAGTRDVTGWFALGFTVEWGGPPPAKRPVR